MIGILPLNPHKISVIVPLISSRCIADILNEKMVFSENSLGFNSGFNGSILESELSKWRVDLDIKIKDTDVYPILAQSIQKNKLFIRQEYIYTCECSRLELPVDQINEEGTYKLLTENGCKICNTVKEVRVDDLYFSLDDPLNKFTLYPENTTKQYNHFKKSILENKSLKISKQRDTGMPVIFNNCEFFIDIDFIHLLYLNSLTTQGVDTIVLSRKTLHFLAKCSFFNKTNCNVLLLTYLNNFNDMYEQIKIKFNSYWQIFLLSVANNSRKNITTNIPIEDIDIISKIDSIVIENYFKENFKTIADMSKGFNRNVLEYLHK